MKARKSFWFKCITVFTGLNLLTQIFYPTIAFALTGGPSQPEMQGFTPVGTTNMVDLSSGSFTYNIPLMDVEGYPINLSYHSGVTMDQEASWCGLGWNINPGEINRQMRGIPDDFNGDPVTEKFNMRDNITVGLSAAAGLKAFGLPIINLNLSAGIFYNNYKGPGVTVGVAPSLSTGVSNKGTLTCGLGLNFNSQSGVDISPTIGFSMEAAHNNEYDVDAGVKVGTTYNSRTGVKGLQMTKDLNVTQTTQTPVLKADGSPKKDEKGNPVTETHIGSGDFSASSSMSFSSPSYIPTIKMPLSNYAVTLDAALGLSIIATDPIYTFSGWFNEQTLATNSQTLPAYGYMYADQARNNPNALLDFNREKDVPFLPHIANLPITNFTYDLYSISGEGVSGEFRPFRGDVGILYDHTNYNTSLSADLGIELGFAELSHNGINANVSTSNTVSDQWLQDNQFASTVSFQSLQPGNINYEPFYIKSIGEKTVNDVNYYSTIGDVDPVYVDLNRATPTEAIAMHIFAINNTTMNVGANLIKTEREKRNQCTSILTAQEASYFGLDKEILSYPPNANVYASACDSNSLIDPISRLSGPRQPWHTSEITVTNPDGKRYVYGIPVYNTVQNEATFAVNGQTLNPMNDDINLVNYSPTDRSTSNVEGLDHYYDEKYIPPYAHSYLLTGILSPDYVDMTGNGISDDDLGQAVKINYTQVYDQSNPYQWRVPFEVNQANYQEGILSNSQDDKGNILYGQKEVWYVHSIESKTMVAQFILGNRQDAFGVTGEDGGINTANPLKYLQEIILYSKADLIAHGANAVPIKTVHFVYDYSLCQGTPNSTASGQGKLTLRQVYFTYGNDNEGSLNSYQFNYNGYNPNFSHNNYDRWGYYKSDTANSGTPFISNEDFPYTSQNASYTDRFATAWNMTDIGLPSGGHITVNYQPNDYAFVQNQRAGQMFTVLGAASSATGSYSQYLYTGGTFNDWLIVKLPVPETNPTNFANDYLAGINQLYFRFAVQVDNRYSGHYEYISGYSTIGGYQQVSSLGDVWAINLNEVSSGDLTVGNANPISLATWQYLRLNLPQYAYPLSQTTGSVLSMIFSVFGILVDVIDMFVGFDAREYAEGGGQAFIPDHSWIRLDNPTYQKLGGGSRVGEVDIADNWANMANGQSSYTYGQTYNYTTTLAVDGQTKTISSGVATYEPLQGGDENPLRTPLPYSQQAILAPNNEFYTETPLGESLYPAPGVVYSKVTVTNLQHPGIERTATGYTVNEFYTAYDFPVLNNWTSLDNILYKPNILTTLLSFGSKTYTTASQGFTVEVNDMPGKEKEQEVYDQTGSEISSIHYYYHVDNLSAPSMHLNNDVQVVNADGSVGVASIGKDIDMYEDMREQETTTQGFGATFNGESFFVPFFAFYLPIIIPSYSSEDTRFRSATTTKYIYRSGLVDSVVNMKYGSYVTTQNVAYDGETGEVLLTQTHNEFNEPLYNFTYPAHLAYDGMGSEYKNIGFVYNNATITGGQFTSPANPALYFTPGDELEYFTPIYNYYTPTYNLTDSLLWVTQPQAGGPYSVMDQHGYPVSLSDVSLKVIRSGRRNMASTPVGSVETMNSPIVSGNISINSSSNILQSSATLFSDLWQVPITNILTLNCSTIKPDTIVTVGNNRIVGEGSNAGDDTIIDPGLVGGASDSCIANFLDSLWVHNQLFATPVDNITFGMYSSCGGDLNEPYYALVSPMGAYGYEQCYFAAQLGNCQITIGTPGLTNEEGGYYFYNTGTLGYSSILSLYNSGKGFFDSLGSIWYNTDLLPVERIGRVAPVPVTINCQQCSQACVNLGINQPFNPYTIGMLGDWRPERNYVYYANRSPNLTASTSNIWNTGLFEHYSPIWTVPSSDTIWSLDTTDKNWTWTSLISMYDSKGNEIEDKDALGRYSGALYGYLQSLPVAVSSNAQYEEIAFDGFEDYGFTSSCNNPCNNNHFNFVNALDYPSVDTTSTTSHTGRYCLQIAAGQSATATRPANFYNDTMYTSDLTHFYMGNGAGIPLFSPDSGLYLLSAWVKENNCGQISYPKDSIMISYTGSSLVYVFHSAGPIIEGWQRFESKFEVPGNATGINVILIAGPNGAYYDDIRMEPFAAEMKSYVYDPFSLRLLATLDENNYATIYEYNDEGILMRVKKETEEGIMTIKESRSSYIRK